MPDKPLTPDEKLQQEFNRWAAAGEGPKMENHHLDITEKTLRLMNLRPGERVRCDAVLGLRPGEPEQEAGCGGEDDGAAGELEGAVVCAGAGEAGVTAAEAGSGEGGDGDDAIGGDDEGVDVWHGGSPRPFVSLPERLCHRHGAAVRGGR